MQTFTKLFSEVINADKRGSLTAFAKAAGTRTGYVSEVLAGALPTVKTFKSWAAAAKLSGKDTTRLVYLLSREKALNDEDSAVFAELTEARFDATVRLLRDLHTLLLKSGVKIPDNIVKRIEEVEA